MGVSYNKVTLLGNVAQDPETRYTQSGKAVTKFALAVNSPQSKEASFVDIIAWEGLGERCNTYLKKGSRALIEGRLSIRSYEDASGSKRKAMEIIINDMQMLSAQSGSEKAPAATSDGKSNRTFVKRKGGNDSAYAGRFA
jgi:single-strand DNA-binding protein